MNKKNITLTICLLISLNAFSKECDDEIKARMIKAGISDETIEKECNNQEEDSENKIENEISKDENIDASGRKNNQNSEKQGIRLELLGGIGNFKLKTNDALNGAYDHRLSGSSYAINYNLTDKDNWYYGGGYQRVWVRSDEWKWGTDKVTGYWTYYNSTYGYFDAQLVVYDFVSTFLYGFVGYEIDLNDQWVFQPNLKFGSKNVTAEWSTYVIWQNYSNQTTNYSESISGLGLEIDLPFMYRFEETFSLGTNICICSSSATFVQGNYEYSFTSSKVISVIFNWNL